MGINNPIILSTAYFPPIEYFARVLKSDSVRIETHENYRKQSYRNRCHIYSPNGLHPLVVPVERGSFHKVPIMDLRIDYSSPWQQLHLKSLQAAYRSSAFYEFYIDEIEEVISNNFKLLTDLNQAIIVKMLDLLEFEKKILFTDTYLKDYGDEIDFRDKIDPKCKTIMPGFNPGNYFQVFISKYEFIPNLSILDLIFNMGTESYNYLNNC